MRQRTTLLAGGMHNRMFRFCLAPLLLHQQYTHATRRWSAAALPASRLLKYPKSNCPFDLLILLIFPEFFR